MRPAMQQGKEYTTNTIGDITTLKVIRKDGIIYHVLIDTKNLYRLKDYSLYVHLSRGKLRVMLYDSKWKLSYLARLILNTPEGFITDHINGDGLDNRESNLRNITQAENNQNLTQLRNNNTSGARGVCWDAKIGKWTTYASVNKKRYFFGNFIDFEEACNAVEIFRALHMPFSKEALCQNGQ